MINITTIKEYEYCISRGYQPLLNNIFDIEINLRIEIQTLLFNGRNRAERNQKFYKYVWDHKPHICEETSIPLKNYSSCYISHILSRGAFPELAYDPRNTNILCLKSHKKWEIGDRQNMKIYDKNMLIINQLKNEYNNRKG